MSVQEINIKTQHITLSMMLPIWEALIEIILKLMKSHTEILLFTM